MFIEYELPPEIYRGSLGLLSGRRDIAQFPSQDILSDRQKGKGLRFGLPISKVRDIITKNVKLSGHGPGLPGKVISFRIVPLDPVAKALAEHGPANKCKCFVSICGAVSMMNRGAMPRIDAYGRWAQWT
jgi:hypothetical protein